MHKKRKFQYYHTVPIFLTVFLFGILFNLNTDSIESIFYDFAIKNSSFSSSSSSNLETGSDFVFIGIDHVSNDYIGDIFPYSNSVYKKALQNLVEKKPRAIVFLPEFENNFRGKNNLLEVNQLVSSYISNGGAVFFKKKIDPWGEGKPPAELKRFNFFPSILHSDGNIFGKDGVTRRAVLTISGQDTLELALAAYINPNVRKKGIRGIYYHEKADASFSLFKYSKKLLNENIPIIPFYKLLANSIELDLIKGKVIIVGSTFSSNSADYKMIPGLRMVPAPLMVAEIAQSIATDNTVSNIKSHISLFLALFVAAIMLLSVFYASPSRGIVLFFITIGFVFIFQWVLLQFLGSYLRISEIIIMGIAAFYSSTPFRSIIENKRNFALKEESRILKEVEELKRNFVSLMSHDLKTPVAKIASVVEVLKMENSDRKILNELNMIDDSTSQLNDFISSILDLTKMETNDFGLKLASIDLNKIVERTVHQLRDIASRHNVQINFEPDVLFPITIDEKLMGRVINNILENGIKYSGAGSIITIKTEDAGDFVALTISDNGVGIDEKELKYIFEKFYRLKNDKIPGNGLGLYLVKYFVELMEGQIKVQSKVSEGTSFVVTLMNK